MVAPAVQVESAPAPPADIASPMLLPRFPFPFFPITSVTRWLLVVFGCAVLAMAQPMSSTKPEPVSRDAATLIYPKDSADRPAPLTPPPTSSLGPVLALCAVFACIGGAWLLFQKRSGSLLANRGVRKLQIEETRPLGNRQHLIVADYAGQKFLIGVTPGQIQFLTHLDPTEQEKPSS